MTTFMNKQSSICCEPVEGTYGYLIEEGLFYFLLNIVRQLEIEHAVGYSMQMDRSHLRLTHGERHMLFFVNGVDVTAESSRIVMLEPGQS
jgi:hypothetical protein